MQQNLKEIKAEIQLRVKEQIKQLLQVNLRVDTIISEYSNSIYLCDTQKNRKTNVNCHKDNDLLNDLWRLKNILSLMKVGEGLIASIRDSIRALSGNNVLCIKKNDV